MAHHVLWNKENRRVSPPVTFISFPVTDVKWACFVREMAQTAGDFLKEQPKLPRTSIFPLGSWSRILLAPPGSVPRPALGWALRDSRHPDPVTQVQAKQNKSQKWGGGEGVCGIGAVPGAGVGVGAALRAQRVMLFASSSQPQQLLLLQGNGCSDSANGDSCSSYIFKRHFSTKINPCIFFFLNSFLFISKYIYSDIKNICLVHFLSWMPGSPDPRRGGGKDAPGRDSTALREPLPSTDAPFLLSYFTHPILLPGSDMPHNPL